MSSKLKVALVYGTRPEIIKLSPLIRCFKKNRIPYLSIHTGQHYTPSMDRVFFEELHLPKAHHQLRVRSKAPFRQGDHTARMLTLIEDILLKERPTHVMVQGDTNTVLAGSLAAAKISTTRDYTGLSYVLCHVESGLRSFDRQMPEEINRFISDHLSDLLFAPTPGSRRHLLKEGVPSSRIWVVGNTVVDAVRQNLEIAKKKLKLSSLTSIKRGQYILVTLHRQENVDEPHKFRSILKGIERSSKALGRPVVFPVHPRTRAKFKAFGIKVPACFHLSEPVGYLEFLVLQSQAGLIMTDSGGIQEEACILKVPCVTLRTTTERPETIKVGANLLAGVASSHIERCAKIMMRRRKAWSNPYGDGHTAERILKCIRKTHR
jgi:UDP-N-acetylglucosamine 2-epimerase (non-hydrolysing)